MAKYGGGYLIFDIRGKTAVDFEGRSAVALTETEVELLETAVAEKLPILYVGPALDSDLIFSTVETAAFVHIVVDAGVILMAVPQIGYSGYACLVEKIGDVKYLITPTV